jgi:PAS domain S-box-containing protein
MKNKDQAAPRGPREHAPAPSVALAPNHLPLRVLVVDDDADTRANLCDILELDGHQVESAGSAAEVLQRRNWPELSAIILDRKLPDGTGEELLPHLKELAPKAAVLVVTGYADLQGAIDALKQGADDYILKPINPGALRASLLRISDRHRLALAKERSEAAFRTLVEAAPCLIVIVRPDHRIVYFSPFAEALTGYRAAAAQGRDFGSFFPPEQRAAVAENLRRVLLGAPVREIEGAVLCQDGSRRWLVWNSQRLPDYEGGPAILAVGQDITQLKHAQERTLQAERLAAIGQMMTGLAHESGNALARSQACLEMLALEVQDRPEALSLVSRIQKAQDHLQQLYEEVRNYAAPLKLERAVCRLDMVWRQAWTNLAVRREGRDAQLCEERAGMDLHCAVDAFRLEQVFRNILDNALAACSGPVVVTIRCTESSLAGRPALRVSVRDNGPGLGAEQRQRIFEPFFTTKTKGTGLGMAIAKRIVDAHGGHIAVGTGPGSGAEVLITLPRDEP